MSVTWTCICVTSSYAVLKLYSVLPLPMYVLMACMSPDAFIIVNCVFKNAGEVNENSKALLATYKDKLYSLNYDSNEFLVKQVSLYGLDGEILSSPVRNWLTQKLFDLSYR